jgi:RNA polymerase sigma factor (sigma-70 family)
VTDQQLRDAWSKFVNTGHESALEQAFAMATPMVFETCLRILRSNEDAHEAQQQTLVEFLRRLRSRTGPSIEIERELITTAKRCARRIRSAHRREHCRQTSIESATTIAATGQDPRIHRLDEEERQILAALMADLTEPERRLLLLHYIEERNQAEVARIIGLSRSRVTHKISEIVTKLQNEANSRYGI